MNQLFEKIMALDVDERHLLRMGHGEEELETEKDYSRFVCDIVVVFCVRYLTLVTTVVTGLYWTFLVSLFYISLTLQVICYWAIVCAYSMLF